MAIPSERKKKTNARANTKTAAGGPPALGECATPPKRESTNASGGNTAVASRRFPSAVSGSKHVVVELKLEAEHNEHGQVSLENDLFKYKPELTLPTGYDIEAEGTRSVFDCALVELAERATNAEGVHVAGTVGDKHQHGISGGSINLESKDEGMRGEENVRNTSQDVCNMEYTASAAAVCNMKKSRPGEVGADSKMGSSSALLELPVNTHAQNLYPPSSTDCEDDNLTDISNDAFQRDTGNNMYARRVIDILKEFETKTNNSEWPSTTSTACYWCCHPFSTVPFGLPVKYADGKIEVTGCFCSIACAAAYNQNSNESVNVKVNRHNILTYLALHLNMNEEITLAPPRELLLMFGGHMTISEFRGALDEATVYLHSFPPMSYKSTQIEEINNENVSNGYREKIVPLDNARIERGMQLKRIKPLVDFKNTLDHSMNLTIRQTSSQPDR